MSLSPGQSAELGKLKRLERQYEGIAKTSSNAEQKHRALVELKKIKDRIDELDPQGQFESSGMGNTARGGASAGASRPSATDLSQYKILSRFTVERASPHSTDYDVNLLYTILTAWESVFMTALFDKHTRLDYSLNAERDTHFALVGNIKRHLKSLVDTIEDHHQATRDDSKEQLFEMKRRYYRVYLNEGAAFLKKMKTFWEDIDQDVLARGTKCTNYNDRIHFDQYETRSFLDGSTVGEVIHVSVVFLNEAIRALRLPVLTDKEDRPF